MYHRLSSILLLIFVVTAVCLAEDDRLIADGSCDDIVREMKFYGILPEDLPEDAPIDVYATDEKYWQSFHYSPGR